MSPRLLAIPFAALLACGPAAPASTAATLSNRGPDGANDLDLGDAFTWDGWFRVRHYNYVANLRFVGRNGFEFCDSRGPGLDAFSQCRGTYELVPSEQLQRPVVVFSTANADCHLHDWPKWQIIDEGRGRLLLWPVTLFEPVPGSDATHWSNGFTMYWEMLQRRSPGTCADIAAGDANP